MTQKSTRLRALKNQIARLEKRIGRLKSQSRKFSRVRLILFLAGIGSGIGLYYLVTEWLGWATMAATLVAFNVVAYFHRRLSRSLQRHQIWLEIKSGQVARMQLKWEEIPLPQTTDPDPGHPFAYDLDLTGRHSLHQLIDTAISRDGSQLLQDWLLVENPEPATIEHRQALVKELAPLTRFRDKLQAAYRLVSKKQLDGTKLSNFLGAQNTPASLKRILTASFVLALLTLALFVLSELNFIPGIWGFSLAVYAIVYFMNQNLLESILADSDLISDELKKFRTVLQYLESYPYQKNERLKKQCEPFINLQRPPSVQLRKIIKVGAAIGLRMNPLFRIILNVAVPWDFYFAWRLNSIKKELADIFPVWLQALQELEALVSLANFAYLNPEYTFPTISESRNPKENIFAAKSLGHPLIPDEKKIDNDFLFSEIGEIALVTGSNMSGKSTFLKTVGVNLALAFAGGPVIAQSLTTSLFRIFTCINISDSVTEGFSFFYAEVRRLKTLLTKLQRQKSRPVLFLIDEIFKGTNNRERFIGSSSYIEALAGQNGVGFISTHDLDLTQLAEKVPNLTNYHFREEVLNGTMVFDYKMRSGPCPTTNALKIMRMEGLPVKPENLL